MRVVQALEFGGPGVLVASETPDPVAGADELMIDVTMAEILFLDTQLRAGWGQEYFDVEPPYVPGTGVGGYVRGVGPGVCPQWIGRPVVARTGDFGGYVERAAVPVGEVFEVPSGTALDLAMAALHDGPTAISRLKKAHIQPGDRVLVNAAAGGLAAWLIPLARRAGAFVVGTARGDQKLATARGFGADAVADYSEAGWQEHVRDEVGEVQVVFDGAGGPAGSTAYELLAERGQFFAYGAASGTFAEIDPDDAARRGIVVIPITDGIAADDQRRLTEEALSHIAAGRVHPVIGQKYPLAEAAAAHAAIEDRRVAGKSLLLT